MMFTAYGFLDLIDSARVLRIHADAAGGESSLLLLFEGVEEMK